MAAADDSRPAGATRSGSDDETLDYVKIAVGREHGLSAAASRRLAGRTVAELRADAALMVEELESEPVAVERDDRGRERDGRGRFAGSMNSIIRRASGRSA